MFAIFILAIVAIGLAASLGFTIISFQNSMVVTATSQRNLAQLEMIAQTIRAHARPVVSGGAVRVPMGEHGEYRTLLPSFIGDIKTPWGASYGYCPLVLPTSINDDVGAVETIHGGINWSVTVKALGANKFVVGATEQPRPTSIGSDFVPNNILGFVLSPAINREEIPRCDEIIFRGGAFVIGMPDRNNDGTPDGPATIGGTVTPIVLETSSLAFMPSDLEPTLFISPSGDGAGATGDDPISLLDAVTFWKAVKPKSMILRFSDGDYNLAAVAPTFTMAEAGRSLRFVGSPSARLIASTPVDAVFGVDASFEGVTVASDVRIRVLAGARVLIDNSRIGHLRVDGGDVTLRSSSSLERSSTRGGSVIKVVSGTLTITQSVGAEALHFDTGGNSEVALQAVGGTVRIAADLVAPDVVLPWSFAGDSRLEVGRKLDDSIPKLTYIDVIAANMEALGSASENGVTSAIAMCPPIRPHVIFGSCSADRGSLKTSSKASSGQLEGWQCGWSAEGEVAPLSFAPTSSTSIAECSAAPVSKSLP